MKINKRNVSRYKELKNGSWSCSTKLVNFKWWWVLIYTEGASFGKYFNQNKRVYKKREDEEMCEWLLPIKEDFEKLYKEQWSWFKNWAIIVSLFLATMNLISCEKEEDIIIQAKCEPGYLVSNEACHNRYDNGSLASATCGGLRTDFFISDKEIIKARFVSIYHDESSNTISVGRYVYDIIGRDCQVLIL